MAGVGLEYDQIKDQGIFEQSITQKYRLGDYVDVGECRYRYCKAQETCTKGQIMSHYDAGIVTLAAASSAVSTSVVGATTIGTRNPAVTVDAQKDWYLVICNSTGEGELYKIKSNTVAAGTSSSTLTLYDPIRTATTRGSTAGKIVPNKYFVQIQNSASPNVEIAVCKAPIAVTANYYFWGQTKGPSAVCVGTGGAVQGTPLQGSTGATGKARSPLSSQLHLTAPLGVAMTVATSSTWTTADLTME